MLRRIIFLTVLNLVITDELKAQFSDDFERYNHSQRISPQSLNWITWSEDPNTGIGYIEDEDGIVSNTDYPNHGEIQHFANSGKQAMFIGKEGLGSQPQDVVLNLQNKSKGLWNLTWKMYIPNNKRAYYNFQENTPVNGAGNWAIQVYFNNNGRGKIKDDRGGTIINFNYPQDEWFEIRHTIDLDGDKILIYLTSVSGSTEIYNADFLSNTQHLGGVDFYSISKKNKFYIDDVVFEKTLPIEDVYIWNNGRWEDINGNFLPGEPDNSYEVILREPFTVGTSNSAKTLNCLNLVFENDGSLTIPEQMNVVISGNLTVPSNNKIIVENGGSFIMLDNTAIINMPDSNSFEYSRTSNEMASVNDFIYWSSPVNDIDVSNFESSAVYTYKTANYIDLFSGYGYPQITGSPDRHDDNGDDWIYAPNSEILIPGKGYAVLSTGASPSKTVTFRGKPNSGFISIPVSLSGNDSNADDDWNLMGNPYPSAIDAKILINSNINISGTLYFWTHNTELGGGNNSGPSDSNYNTNDYASFNLSGGIAASTGGEIPNGSIASGQGFFMEVNGNGVITFNNDMRVINTDGENIQFYKTSNNKRNYNENGDILNENRIWLSLSNDKGVFSQSLVAFLPGATDDYEGKYDGIRGGADLNSKFYSIMDDKELAIQGRSVLNENVQIPFGFYITKPDIFNISIDKLKGIDIENNIEVYLIDHELNKTHNLKQADYQFNVLEPGINNQRFTLQFTGSTLGIENDLKEEKFIITINDHNLKVTAKQIVKTLRVYDMLGRILIDSKPNKQDFFLNSNNVKKGSVLIIHAVLENGSAISKKIIKY